MKIAILLTGQLRTFEMVKHLHKHALMQRYNCDVFMSVDTDNSLQTAYENNTAKTDPPLVQQAVEFFEPVGLFVNDLGMETITDRSPNSEEVRQLLQIRPYSAVTLRQYFTVYQAYKLLQDHVKISQSHYDIVVRLRFDQLLWQQDLDLSPIFHRDSGQFIYSQSNIKTLHDISLAMTLTFGHIRENTIYVLGFGDYEHYKYANDQFWYHAGSLASTMSGFYNAIPSLTQFCIEKNIANRGCFPECLFYHYIQNSNIVLEKSHLSGVFVRGVASTPAK